MTSKYTAGSPVLARDSSGLWRPAIIMRPAPYPNGNCDGAYIQWTDLPSPCPSYISTGGWASGFSIKEVA